MASDLELLEDWRGGKRSAADELLRRHFDSVYRFFRSKLAEDVEDLVQRTFLGCVEGVERIGEAGFRAYLFGVARNQLLDHLRKRYRRPEGFKLSEVSIADLGTSPSRQVARQQEHELLASAMQTLPIDTQILLELAYWEGLKGPEIAAVLGIPENTVRGRLSRARSLLRQRLETVLGSPKKVTLLLSTIQNLAD